jgi:prephenate dehydrogenase
MATSIIRVGLLGLGRLGASFGLAVREASRLKDARQQFHVLGYDTDAAQASAAQAMGAVDALAGRAAEAAAERDVLVMTLPYGEVQGAYAAIAPAVRSGAVVLDTTPHTGRAAAWARAALPAGVHRVGVHAAVAGAWLFDGLETTAFASADLLRGGTLLILAEPDTAPAAVELAGDFAALIQMTAHFADPAEHDGWNAWLEAVPAALGLAAFRAARASDGWGDMQRAANPNFGRLTHHLASAHPADLRALLSEDPANTLRALDAVMAELGRLRAQIAAHDAAALGAGAEADADAYTHWLARRERGDWNEQAQAAPTQSLAGGAMTALFGGAIAGRLARRAEADDGRGKKKR